MRRVDCVGLDFSTIYVDADKIVFCKWYSTNSGESRIAIYFSTDSSAEPLNVRDMPGTVEALMPAKEE